MAPACRHHWLLSAPQNDRVMGRCKRCDLERIYPARLEETDRGDDYRELVERPSAIGNGAWAGRRAS